MKKGMLLVPDKIYRTIGTLRFSKTDLVEFIPENLLMVFSDDSNYHDRNRFHPEDVE